MPYELGALIDSTRTITVHSAIPSDGPAPHDELSAIVLREIVARDPARTLAFRELSTALQHVRHGGLLQVVDLSDCAGRPVAIAPLPPGAPLSRLLLAPKRQGRRFGLEPSARVVLDAARAAQVIHAARPDLRPLGYLSADTIWVTVAGRAVLLPSARCAPMGAVTTATIESWGRYRAPECGEVGGGGDSADVYSLAVLLWDLLALGRPRPDSDAVDATSETPSWIDPDIVRLVMRSLSTDVSARPRDPGAFAAELLRVVARLGTSKGQPQSSLPLAPEDDENTAPGFVPTFATNDDEHAVRADDVKDPDDAVTVELPALRLAPPAHGAAFAIVAPAIRAAAEPALHDAAPRPAAPRPAAPRPAAPRPVAPRPAGTHPSAPPAVVPRPIVQARKPSRSLSPKLRIVEPAEVSAVAELTLTNEPRRWVVGRAATAHFVVADPDMSREHFAIFWEGEGRYRVHDLGSKNGLFVNGRATTDLPLTSGDEVRAGATRLRFEA